MPPPPPQVSDELRFTREDDEDAKVKAMEFYFPKGEQVGWGGGLGGVQGGFGQMWWGSAAEGAQKGSCSMCFICVC